MDIKKKTYAVNGLMEWIAVIPCGRATMTVPFTGGSLSGYGVVPAQFTTEDPMKQMIIERSDYYKSGKIVLLRETEGTGKYKERLAMQHAAVEGMHRPGQAATASAVLDSALNPHVSEEGFWPAKSETQSERPGNGSEEQTDTDGGEEQTDTDGDEDQGDYGETGQNTTADGKAIVDVTDIDDARDYLADEFGIARSNLRSNVSVMRAAEEHKIVFRGLE